jgi:hypothetical protein
MHVVAEVTRLLSVAALGLYVGAMLTEGCVLVPYWRALPPPEFLAWYAANDRRLLGFFGPVTAATAVFALAAALVAWWHGDAGRWPALVAAVLTLAAVATFSIYFQAANASFATASIGVDRVGAELARWATWHWGRTVLSVAALAAALLSLWRLLRTGG